MPKVTLQHKLEVRDKIVQAAIIEFARNGFEGAKMDNVAKTANLSKGTPYLYFKSKDDLFYAICEYNLENLKIQLAASLPNKSEDLVSDATRIYDFFSETTNDTNAVWLEMVVQSIRKPKLRKALTEHREKIKQTITGFVRLQVERGIFRKDIDIESVSLGMMSVWEGLTTSRMLRTDEDLNRRTWIETLRAIFVGIS